jgi:hypothetical protein
VTLFGQVSGGGVAAVATAEDCDLDRCHKISLQAF